MESKRSIIEYDISETEEEMINFDIFEEIYGKYFMSGSLKKIFAGLAKMNWMNIIK